MGVLLNLKKVSWNVEHQHRMVVAKETQIWDLVQLIIEIWWRHKEVWPVVYMEINFLFANLRVWLVLAMLKLLVALQVTVVV